MIATDPFVYIHQPKTGGTFVTSVLQELRDLLGTCELTVRRREKPFVKVKFKHGGASDIPARHRHKTILASIRNPFDMYVSEYEFGWWKRPDYPHHFRRLVPDFEQRYPKFPAISVEDFVCLYNSAFCSIVAGCNFNDSQAVGWLTERFVEFYFRRPRWEFGKLNIDDATWERVRKSTATIHYLHSENLNQELHDFLVELGYPADKLEFVRSKDRVLPGGKGRTPQQKWQRYYTPRLFEHLRRRERLLFRLFPEYDQPLTPVPERVLGRVSVA